MTGSTLLVDYINYDNYQGKFFFSNHVVPKFATTNVSRVLEPHFVRNSH